MAGDLQGEMSFLRIVNLLGNALHYADLASQFLELHVPVFSTR